MPKPAPKVHFVKTMKNAANHGRNIFIYNNIQTNQVIYSLTRALNVSGAPIAAAALSVRAADRE
jgi:hypothetical protein